MTLISLLEQVLLTNYTFLARYILSTQIKVELFIQFVVIFLLFLPSLSQFHGSNLSFISPFHFLHVAVSRLCHLFGICPNRTSVVQIYREKLEISNWATKANVHNKKTPIISKGGGTNVFSL